MSGEHDLGPGHPAVRRWVRDHPDVAFSQGPTDPDVQQLVSDLGLGVVLRDLGGEDNLTVLVDDGRHVLRSYKPFVPRERIAELQQLRKAIHAAGLATPVPIEIGGRSIHRCGQRWAEVEPRLVLPGRAPTTSALFGDLGRLHQVLAQLPSLAASDLRPSFVSVDVLRDWVEINTLDQLMSVSRASELRHLLDRIEERWIRPDALPIQLIHADPHPGNILGTGARSAECVYLDFGGVEIAPRAHDLALAVAYQLAEPRSSPAPVVDELPDWLDAYDRTNPTSLTRDERDAIPGYVAAVTAYYDICDWGPGWRSLGSQLLDAVGTTP